MARSAMPSSWAAEAVVTPLLAEIAVGSSWSAQSCDGCFKRVGVDRLGGGGPADDHPLCQSTFDGVSSRLPIDCSTPTCLTSVN